MHDKPLFVASLISFALYFLFLTALFTPLRSVLSPFVSVIIIVYLFLPCVKWLKKHNVKNTFATIIVYCCILGGGLFVVLYAAPKIFDAVNKILDIISGYISNSVFETVKSKLFTEGMGSAYLAVTTVTKRALNIIVSFVAALYILSDSDSVNNAVKEFVPDKLVAPFRVITDDVKLSLDSFFKGQLLIASLLFLIDGIFLYVLKIPYSWGLALVAAVLDIIPYVGAFVAMGIIITVTFISAPGKLIIVVIGLLVIQQIENNIITPKISADTLALHPAITVLALYVGAYGGFWGILLAIPLVCVFRRLFIRFIQSIL